MDFLKIGKIFAQDYYAVPDYQRDYEWTNAQISTLIDDVFDIIKNGGKENHFFGAIVTIPFESNDGINMSIDIKEYGIDESSVKHIVDGQQRLTTFSVFIAALHDMILDDENTSLVFKKNYAEKQLEGIVLGNNYSSNSVPAPRLILNGNTGRCFNNGILKNSDVPYNKVFKGAKRLLNAYKIFVNEIGSKKTQYINDGLIKDSETFYSKVIEAITNRIVFVEIECDASADAFQVFDSLNGKGLDLTAADRIKNIFMSWSPSGKGIQKWDSFVNDVGEEYLASFFIAKFFYIEEKRIPKNKLPDTFKKFRADALNDFDYFYNESLKKEGDIYGKLRSANTSNKKVNAILKDFQSLKMDQVYVLLFAVVNRYGEMILDTDDYVNFASRLQCLMVRMQVCEKSTNRIDTLFANCINSMKPNGSALSLIIKKIDDEIKASVDDQQFKESFARFSPNDSKVGEFYLRHIENYKRKENKNRNSVDIGLTVEHIIPQNLNDLSVWYGALTVPEEIKSDFKDSVVENIGNKALLYEDDNSAAGNRDYNYKLGKYKDGKNQQTQGTPYNTFYLIKEVVDEYPDRFNHDEVFERAKKLADIAVKIW